MLRLFPLYNTFRFVRMRIYTFVCFLSLYVCGYISISGYMLCVRVCSVCVFVYTNRFLYIHRSNPKFHWIECRTIQTKKKSSNVRHENTTSDWVFEWRHTNIHTYQHTKRNRKPEISPFKCISSEFYQYQPIFVSHIERLIHSIWLSWNADYVYTHTHIHVRWDDCTIRTWKSWKGWKKRWTTHGWRRQRMRASERESNRAKTNIERVMVPPFIDKNDVAFLRNKILAGYILYRKQLPLHQSVCVWVVSIFFCCFCFCHLLLCSMVSRDVVLLLLLSCAINRQEEDNKKESNGNEIRQSGGTGWGERGYRTAWRMPFEWYSLTMGSMQVRYSIHI